MIIFLVGAAVGILVSWLFGRFMMWGARQGWESDEPSDAQAEARQRFFAKMTYDALMRVRRTVDAEIAKRQP